jgi:hypothetical protein
MFMAEFKILRKAFTCGEWEVRQKIRIIFPPRQRFERRAFQKQAGKVTVLANFLGKP